ncbi:MAG TPA: thiamine pyrophosphate-dependent enzyme [Candidatus Acidoferrales bacterium]|nr:thiamine pyrophosphate-dependent enzyme [Candidatus Acidoferrales bacterium]
MAQAITKILVSEGVRVGAGIGGQSVERLANVLVAESDINICYARQERVAIDIVDGYARVSGKPGIAFADHGPGAANAMAGIVNSYGDSVPLLFFAGANRRFEVPRRGQKELPIHDVFKPVTNWTATILDPSQIVDILRRAFVALRAPRPGPVVIGMPYDLCALEAPEFRYRPAPERIRSAGDPRAVESAVRALAAASRPYVCVGAGVLSAEATPEMVELAELLTLPVASTLNGKSAFPENHPLALGKGGVTRATYATLQATRFAQEADVILSVGASLQRHAFLDPIPDGVTLIQIDANPAELCKEAPADIPILGDAKLVLRQMIDAARSLLPASRLAPRQDVIQKIERLRQEWLEFSKPLLTSDEVPINPFRVTWELCQLVNPDETIVLHDAGSVRGSTCQHYTATVPHSFIGFGVQSAMGWSLGAAIGAKLAAPEKLVVAFTGDEAFGETALDLETAVASGIPILMIMINNRPFQDRAPIRKAKIKPVGDYSALARALGAEAKRVEHPGELRGALSGAIHHVKAGKTALVEVMTKRVATSLYPYKSS